MVNAQLTAILQFTSIIATIICIALLVAFELTPAVRQRHSLKVLLPCFMVLGLLIISGAVIHPK
jgi:hypothetical protein